MDAGVRYRGSLFNQPQYLALREQVAAMQGQLDTLAVRGSAERVWGRLRGGEGGVVGWIHGVGGLGGRDGSSRLHR